MSLITFLFFQRVCLQLKSCVPTALYGYVLLLAGLQFIPTMVRVVLLPPPFIPHFTCCNPWENINLQLPKEKIVANFVEMLRCDLQLVTFFTIFSANSNPFNTKVCHTDVFQTLIRPD